MCSKIIEINAKSGNRTAVISLRQTELVGNLRVLVAARFEKAIEIVVLVFGGQVLLDVGTIDGHGITAGVTVHVIFRQLIKLPTPPDNGTLKPPAMRFKMREFIKPLLENSGTLRDILESVPQMKAMLEKNLGMRQFLSSDRNLREVFSIMLSPAKQQEMRRMHDVHLMRLESMYGCTHILGKISFRLRKAYEDNVAQKYQNTSERQHNQQRGRENKLPLPNPWRRVKQKTDVQVTIVVMKVKCDLTLLDAQKISVEAARELLEKLEPTQTDVTSLNLFEFMSRNKKRWEEQFRSQLEQLRELGHMDWQRNICALLISSGDVPTAVKQLKKWNR
ncbi:ubiquilin-1 [Drosophila grimshawi]|uniref:GH19051 n=1 Tax=Drosophila grimshawi TaxID=7222 RepID=B4JI89_DROGR|nr:ubiquilin-1 [Drosophila grimshawi]EDV92970.1 GH19051 [Drosophila grimshawi]